MHLQLGYSLGFLAIITWIQKPNWETRLNEGGEKAKNRCSFIVKAYIFISVTANYLSFYYTDKYLLQFDI